jgi:cold shock CspA family protein
MVRSWKRQVRLAFEDDPEWKKWGLGNIAWGVTGDLDKWHKDMEPTGDEYASWVWKRYDEKFRDRPDYHRPDYLLWRAIFRPLYPSKLTPKLKDAFSLTQEGLECPKEIVAWSTLAVLACLLMNTESTPFSEDQTRQLAELGEHRLGALTDIDGRSLECTAIRLLALDAIYKARTASGLAFLTVPECSDYLDHIVLNLKRIDKDWKLASPTPFGTDALAKERKRGRPILVPLPHIELVQLLRNPIFDARAFCRDAVYTGGCLDDAAELLLRRALSFAILAWRQAFSLRRGEEEFRKHLTHYRGKPRLNITWAHHQEMLALYRAAQAARDIGDHLLNARLAAFFIWQAPEALCRQDPEYDRRKGYKENGDWVKGTETKTSLVQRLEEAVNKVGASMREIGLQLPSETVESQEERDKRTAMRLDPETTCAGRGADPHALRDEQAQQHDPRWRLLIAANYSRQPGSPHAPLEKLNHAINSGNTISLDILQAGFSLTMEHGMFRTASNVLKALASKHVQTSDQLLRFAHSIKRAAQLIPVLIWGERHKDWQYVLREAWAPIYDKCRIDETLAIHEVLVGRGLTLARAAKVPRVATCLTAKLYEQLSEEEIREVLDSLDVVRWRGPATVTVDHLRQWLASIPESPMERPVCASVVRLDEQRFSLLVIAPSGEPTLEILSLPGLLDEADCLVKGPYLRAWALRRTRIPWEKLPGVSALTNYLTHRAKQLVPGLRWIILAVEPKLAGLPWQEIVRQACDEVVISLVPNLSWAEMAYRVRDNTEGVHLELCDDPHPEIASFRHELEQQQDMLKDCFGSVAVVLAHGIPASAADPLVLPEVKASDGPLQSVKDWHHIAGCRLCFLHSCHAGTTSEVFLGDLGGIPGVLLSLKTRLLFAPVSQVPLETIRVIHRHLTDKEGPAELGLRYLAATMEDPRVALYNLYGFADEPQRSFLSATRPRADKDHVLTGVISWKDPCRGYGWIQSGAESYFFHYSHLRGISFSDIAAGQSVEFEVVPSFVKPGLMEAADVRPRAK